MLSRGSQRPPTLTEELERLEQQITLTYQEIDHNFNKAHRIVTGQILPIVERYAKESTQLWNGAAFWKTFFEASAGVSLNNYVEEDGVEETTVQNEETTQFTETMGTTEMTATNLEDEMTVDETTSGDYTQASAASRPGTAREAEVDADESMVSDTSLLESLNMEGQQSTPRNQRRPQQWANIDSPYDTLRREMQEESHVLDDDDSPSAHLQRPHTTYNFSELASPNITATTPQRGQKSRTRAYDESTMLPDSSPFELPKEDPLLHRVLDKTWRIQATPLNTGTARRAPKSASRSVKLATPRKLFDATLAGESDSDDSPVRPDFQTQYAFETPQRKTPVRGGGGVTPGTNRNLFGKNTAGGTLGDMTYDDDDDDSDIVMDRSPPVTIQFSLPAKKILATPAREASRRIVGDLLQAAGVGEDDSTIEESLVLAKQFDEDDDIFA